MNDNVAFGPKVHLNVGIRQQEEILILDAAGGWFEALYQNRFKMLNRPTFGIGRTKRAALENLARRIGKEGVEEDSPNATTVAALLRERIRCQHLVNERHSLK